MKIISNLKIRKKFLSILTVLQIAVCSSSMSNCFFTLGIEKPGTVRKASEINLTINVENEFDFDNDILNSSIILQTDERISNIPYNTSSIRQAGCGPISITNALILAFDLKSSHVSYLVNDVIALGSRYNNITKYMIGNDNTKTKILNEIRRNFSDKIIYGGSDYQNIISNIKNSNMDNTYVFGRLNYDVDNCKNIIKIIDYLYDLNPDTNIILYNMSAGILSSKNPFGSYSDSGHYITLLINVREFKENNSIYMIDSVAKNLKGETNHKVNYNFVETSCRVNSLYNISRVSEGVLKLTGKDKINTRGLFSLELGGGCGIIICPNNLTKNLKKAIGSK